MVSCNSCQLVFAMDIYQPTNFPKPKSIDNWFSKDALGEGVWLNRDKIPISKHHLLTPKILTAAAAVGTILTIWGVYRLDICSTLLGMPTTYFGKLWFVDRMVWLM